MTNQVPSEHVMCQEGGWDSVSQKKNQLKIKFSTLGDFYGQGGGKEGALPSALAVTTTMEEEVNIIINIIIGVIIITI